MEGKWEPRKTSLEMRGCLSVRPHFMEALRARQQTLGFHPRTVGCHRWCLDSHNLANTEFQKVSIKTRRIS